MAKVKTIFGAIAKFLFSAVAVIVIAVLIFAGTTWFFPQLILNSSNFDRYLVPLLARYGISFRKNSVSLHSHSHSFWKKSLAFELNDSCFKYDARKPELCFDRLAIDLTANLKNFSLQDIYLQELSAKSKGLNLDLSEEKKRESSKSGTNYLAWLRKTEVDKIDIDLPEVEIALKDERLSANVKVQNLALDFLIEADVVSQKKKNFESAILTVTGARLESLADIVALDDAQADVKIDKVTTAHVEANVEKKSGTDLLLKMIAKYTDPTVRADLKFAVDKKNQAVATRVTGDIFLPKQLKGPLRISDCSARATLDDTNEKDALPVKKADLRCLFYATTKDVVSDHTYLGSLPPKVDVLLLANADTKKNASGSEELKGTLRLEVGPVTNSFIEGKMAAHYDINFTEVAKGSKVTFDPILIDSKIRINNFFEFARFMNSAGILIPSPINVLKGTVDLSGEGEIKPSPLQANLDVTVSTKLATGAQNLYLDAQGKLGFTACVPPNKNMVVDIDLLATQMKLRLPDIDYTDPPPLVPDSRFVLRKAPKKASSCGLAFNFAFKNQLPKPILISAAALRESPDIPVNIDIDAKDGAKPKGKVWIENYHAKLFRQKALVNSFSVNLETKEVAGEVTVNHADYVITVLISGTTQSVRVDMQSDPPMPREQVLAILIFGKPLEGLDTDESGSVKNTDAAAKDGALSLASLYLFASTPIESIGYNPNTNGVTAKVKLANGTSLNVGANGQGFSDVGVTRRLSKHWRIQTTLKEPNQEQGEEQRSATTLLEWFNRF